MATADLLEALMLVAEEDDETELRELMVGAEQLRRRLRQVGPGLEEHAEAVLAQFGMVEVEAAPAGRRISLHALEMRNAAIAQTRELLNHNKLGAPRARRIRTPSSEKSHRRASAPTSAVSERGGGGGRRAEEQHGGDLPPLGRRDADALTWHVSSCVRVASRVKFLASHADSRADELRRADGGRARARARRARG